MLYTLFSLLVWLFFITSKSIIIDAPNICYNDVPYNVIEQGYSQDLDECRDLCVTDIDCTSWTVSPTYKKIFYLLNSSWSNQQTIKIFSMLLWSQNSIKLSFPSSHRRRCTDYIRRRCHHSWLFTDAPRGWCLVYLCVPYLQLYPRLQWLPHPWDKFFRKLVCLIFF